MSAGLETLLPIRTTGTRPPVYCVPPISGSAYTYTALGRFLPSDQPVYGLEAPGFDDGRKPLTSLGDLSAEYLDTLQLASGGDPFHLLGWSMGGAIAFDMAQRLSAMGAAVPLLVVIDAAVPVRMDLPPEKAIMRRFLLDMMGVPGAVPSGLDDLLRALPDDVTPLSAFTTIERSSLLPPEIDREFLGDRYQVFRAHIGALFAHEAQGTYGGRMLVFRAAATAAETMVWSAVASDVETHVLPGDHYSIWTGDRLREMGSVIRCSLERCSGDVHPERVTPER